MLRETRLRNLGELEAPQRRLRSAALGVGLALTLAACGLSEDDQDAADSLSTVIVGSSEAKSVKDTAPCVAEKWVGEVGRTDLRRAGLINGRDKSDKRAVTSTLAGKRPVPPRVARGYGAAWYSCADFDTMARDLDQTFPAASDEDLDEYADCLKEIDDDAWRVARTRLVRGRGDGAPTEVTGCRRDLRSAARS